MSALSDFITEHEFDPLIFDCPDCEKETGAHLLVDRRDIGSGCTWVVCRVLLRAALERWHVGA